MKLQEGTLTLKKLLDDALKAYKDVAPEYSLMLCRKFIEAFVFYVANNEGIYNDIAPGMSFQALPLTISLAQISRAISYNYALALPYKAKIRRQLSKIITLSNQVAHFNTTENQTSISENKIAEILNDTLNWYVQYANYHQSFHSVKVNVNNQERPFPVSLQYISIKKYQSIQEVVIDHVPNNAQFVVFAGENGEGKTALLQAIAIGAYGGWDKQADLIFDSENLAAIDILFNNNPNEVYKEYRGISNFYPHIQTIDNFVAYGASRLQLQSPESMEDNKMRHSPVYSLFRTDGVLLNIEHWLKENRGKKDKYEAVKNTLLTLLPHISDIKYSTKTNQFRYIEHQQEVSLAQLSAGHKSIVGMIGDLIIRLYDKQPTAKKPSDLVGLVLIDELETHLHPKWQKLFPKLLADTFPKVQFIVTTHSVIPFLGMPQNTVFYHVSRQAGTGTEIKQIAIDVTNLLPEQILTSPLFDMDSLRNIHSTDVAAMRTEDTYNEIVLNDNVKKQLKELAEKLKQK